MNLPQAHKQPKRSLSMTAPPEQAIMLQHIDHENRWLVSSSFSDFFLGFLSWDLARRNETRNIDEFEPPVVISVACVAAALCNIWGQRMTWGTESIHLVVHYDNDVVGGIT